MNQSFIKHFLNFFNGHKQCSNLENLKNVRQLKLKLEFFKKSFEKCLNIQITRNAVFASFKNHQIVMFLYTTSHLMQNQKRNGLKI
jgi:hypothetical protein